MFSNWKYRLLAVALAVICWYLVTGREIVETWVEVPVELVKTSPDLIIRGGLQTKINARIRGPKAMVRALDPKSLAYPLDLSGLEPGANTVAFQPGQVSLPGLLTVVEVNPPSMDLEVDRLVEKQARVEPDVEAHLDDDFELVGAVPKPDTVTLRGPQQIVGPLEEVRTRTIVVNATRPDVMSQDIGLALPPEVEATPAQVRVGLQFAEKTKDVWVRAKVRVAPADMEGVAVSPDTVKLQVRAPVSQLRRADFKDDVSATVVVPSTLEPGRHAVAYRIKLPPGCELIKAVPEQVGVQVRKQ